MLSTLLEIGPHVSEGGSHICPGRRGLTQHTHEFLLIVCDQLHQLWVVPADLLQSHNDGSACVQHHLVHVHTDLQAALISSGRVMPERND